MNVLIITIDSLRADHVSFLGYSKKTTPYLDKLSKKGLVFTNAISCGPDTPTSIYPMITSSYVLEYYASRYRKSLKTSTDEFEEMKKVILDIYKYENTLARILRKEGYKTAAFHSNPYLSGYYNFGKDFDYFYDSLEKRKYSIKQKIKNFVERNKILYNVSWILYKNIYSKIVISVSKKRYKIPYERAENINSKALNWLKHNKSKFFLWIHYMDVHFPYLPPEEFCSVDLSPTEIIDLNNKMLKNPKDLDEEEIKILLNLYDDEIRYLDTQISFLIDSLEELGLTEETLIVITADHGDEFGDHGDFAHHNAKLYDELIRVPLMILNTEYSGRISEVVSLIDLAPTILDLIGIPIPKKFQGRSLIPIIEGDKRGGVISETIKKGKRVISYRTNEWKFIWDNYRDRKELYNVVKDPKEKENVYGENEISKLLEQKVEEHLIKQKTRIASLKRKYLNSKIKMLKTKF